MFVQWRHDLDMVGKGKAVVKEQAGKADEGDGEKMSHYLKQAYN